MASSLFRSRLRPPANPPHHVRRQRLLGLVDEAVTAPVTLVVAPAGAGKTSLLVDWRSEATVPTAWLTVDETDREGSQLWVAVAAAVAELAPDLAPVVAQTRRPGSPTHAVEDLIDELAEAERPPSVLIVDDIHLLDDEEDVVASLELFVRFMPSWLHLVLASRRTPKLPIDRLRARGQLCEVHFAELRFSDEEAEDMLTRLAPSLTREQIVASVGRADGWAAGLQLSALAARSEHAQHGSLPYADETDLLVADYVWHEVLAHEPADVVDVLLDTCVVKRANPSLAAALTGRPDAGDLLLLAERRGLFVSRLDRSGWLELHAVVRGVMVDEASSRSAERVALLHARAAQWFEDAGEVALALDQWLLAGQPREALRLLASAEAALYDSGREATIFRAIDQIPLTVVTADVQAMLDYAWCNLLVDRRRFLESVRDAAAIADRSGDLSSSVRGRLTVLQSIAATMTGDWELGGRRSRVALGLLGDQAASDALGRFAWNMIARDVALSEAWDDRSAQVDTIRTALSRDPERRLAFEGTRALGEALAGRPVDAIRVAAGVRGVARVNNLMILRSELGLAEGIAHRELGDRPRAVTELVSMAESTFAPMTHVRVAALLELAQLRLDEGDLDAAERAFASASELVRSDYAGPGGVGWLARTATLLALARADVGAARAWAAQVDDPFWGEVSRARVCLADGRRSDADVLLDKAVPRCVRHEVVRDLLRVRAAEGQDRLEVAAHAVELATSASLLQTVAAEGPDVVELLEHNAWMAPKPWLDRLRRVAPVLPGGPFVDPSLPGEHLTDRELDVLRMLPSRLTFREIADELFISVNTLKFHLKVIYRKLGVSSRDEAAELARRMTRIGRSVRRPGSPSA